MWDKLERKFGKYAIPHLMNYLIGGYIIGYLFELGQYVTGVDFLFYMSLDPYQIFHITNGFPIPQIWRLFTWVIMPPEPNLFFGIIMMIFYWQLGTVLENTWGVFRFNCYIFGGMIFTVLGALFLYAITGGNPQASYLMSQAFSTNYINLSIFLAFALCYPDMKILLYFFIPIKMKWMAFVYAVLIIFDFVRSGIAFKIVIIASLLNFIIFYLTTRDYYRVASRDKRKRKINFGQKRDDKGPVPKHRCCICGRTDISNPELEFRFCSKCNGNYEYCQDHLFTHVHKK